MAFTAKIFIWPTTAMVVFAGAPSPMHEHVALQFAVAVGAEARARSKDGKWVSAPALLVPQALPHEYDATDGVHLVLWIEPESLAGRAIRERFPDDEIHAFSLTEVRELIERVSEVLGGTLGPDEATKLRDGVLELLAGGRPKPPGRVDPRVRRALSIMFEHRAEDLTVGDLAERVGVSESHLSHLFREQIGVSVSRYRMWLRSVEAARLLMAGSSITEVAYAAGFADAAHLSRTFKRLFGQTPSTTQQETVQLFAIDEEF